MTEVLVVGGTRPEAIKLAPVMAELRNRRIATSFAWTGQHYDFEMSRIFLEQLSVPDPDAYLNIKGKTHGQKTSQVILRVEQLTADLKPSIILAEGDTDSVLGTAIAAAKSRIPFAHVEAGLRSYDRDMPEEVNRITADHLSDFLFAPTTLSSTNLTHEGIPVRSIYLTGNTVIDTAIQYRKYYLDVGTRLLFALGLPKRNFILVTVHREENTENKERLLSIVKALIKLSKSFPIVFPIHPRTRMRLTELNLIKRLSNEVKVCRPLGYLEFMGLLANSRVVLTDSGGVQEEATVTGTPTVTLRYNTERPETVAIGLNVVAGTRTDEIVRLTMRQIKNVPRTPRARQNPFGDGRSGMRIAGIIEKALRRKRRIMDSRRDPYITYALKPANSECSRATEKLSSYGSDGLAVSVKDAKRARYSVYRGPISGLSDP